MDCVYPSSRFPSNIVYVRAHQLLLPSSSTYFCCSNRLIMSALTTKIIAFACLLFYTYVSATIITDANPDDRLAYKSQCMIADLAV